MSKSIGASLLSDIRRTVTTLATCVYIRRKDGKEFRLTSHDHSLKVEGDTYTADVVFQIAAIDSSSMLSVDNTEITLACDEVLFKKQDFEVGLFDNADCQIFFCDYNNLNHGKITMRRGWFTKIVRNQKKIMQITVAGLLKILDFEVGRYYQPSCDADFGDTRCKVAVDRSQAYDRLNPYHIGDWVYYYNTDLMTEIALINPSFEDQGPVGFTTQITGWRRTPGSSLSVSSSPAPSPEGGSYVLVGGEGGTASIGLDHTVYQDIDLVAAGIDPTDIDDGKISLGLFTDFIQTLYLLDPVRMKIELQDVTRKQIAVQDSGYFTLDKPDTWRGRAHVTHCWPDTRYVRVSISLRQDDGILLNAAADNVRLYWWDHTEGNPYLDTVHRLTRIAAFDSTTEVKPLNNSFEANSIVANANNPTITGWTTGSGNWWRTATSLGSSNQLQVSNDSAGAVFLSGGDDGSGIQKEYTITQDVTKAQLKLDNARLLLGKYVGRFSLLVGFYGPTAGTATVQMEILDVSNVVIYSELLLNDENSGVTGLWSTVASLFVLPALTNKIRITLKAKSDPSESAARVGFDKVAFNIIDVDRPSKTDPFVASGNGANTDWDQTPGAYTIDGNLIWKGMDCYQKYDVVSAVTDRKTFNGTSIDGISGQYVTGLIQWVSGQNVGLKNVIRLWDPVDKELKLYFKSAFPIEVGDRFTYVRACQRRFQEDCQTIFQNQVNFRGFPHLPGRLRNATDDENATG